MNVAELSKMLARNTDEVCRKLLPGGKVVGGEWCVGDINGDAGKSLKVRVKGEKRGVWSDFQTGEGGDLIDLWREVNGLSVAEAITEIKLYLNITDHGSNNYAQTYTKPAIPKYQHPKTTLSYLLDVRKLSKASIKAYEVSESGNNVLFPFKFDGKLRMLKQRSYLDKKEQRPTSANQEPCLFGWQAIPDNQRVIYIVEGEFDAMAMFDYDYPSLSVPFGGGGGAKQSWIENEFHNLDRFEEIFLCMDSDEAGQEGTKEIIKRLGRERCRVVELPEKDANQCLLSGVTKDKIDAAIRGARSLDPEELKPFNKFEEETMAVLFPDGGIEPGFFPPWKKTHDKIRFRWHEISISNGINGHGKSQIVGEILLSAMKQEERVCIASMEIKPARLIARLVKQTGGLISGIPSRQFVSSMFDWYKEKAWIYECTGVAKGQRILDTFAYAYKRYGVRVFVIDSLMMCGIDEDDYNGQKQFVSDLCDFKNEHECHIFLVTHSKKGISEDIPGNKFDVKGSGAITDLVDNVFTIWRNKRKEKEMSKPEEKRKPGTEDYPDALLICSKQRNGDWEGKVNLWFCRNSYQYLEYATSKPLPYLDFSTQQKRN